jgi:hypothetical protein
MLAVAFVFLGVVCIALGVGLYYSIKKNLELLDLLESSGENFAESLEELNRFYERIDRKSKLELFLDEPVTRELVEDIKGTKKAIKKLAEKISVFIDEEKEE